MIKDSASDADASSSSCGRTIKGELSPQRRSWRKFRARARSCCVYRFLGSGSSVATSTLQRRYWAKHYARENRTQNIRYRVAPSGARRCEERGHSVADDLPLLGTCYSPRKEIRGIPHGAPLCRRRYQVSELILGHNG
jgi:hypothetical protein